MKTLLVSPLRLHSRWLLAAALSLTATAVMAEEGDVQEAQARANRQTRAELSAKRAAVQKAYDDKVKDCRARFAVTGCLEEAHAWRIDALRPLSQQEKEVNALERQQRAAAQRERVQAKDREAAADASRRGTEVVKAAARPASEGVLPPTRTPRAHPEQHQKQLQREQAAAERKAAERRQAAASRRADQQQHEREARKQADKRAAKPSDPKRTAPVHLPTPSASDIQSLPSR